MNVSDGSVLPLSAIKESKLDEIVTTSAENSQTTPQQQLLKSARFTGKGNFIKYLSF